MAKAKKNDTGANLGFEAKLWLAADKMRNNMDAAEYKHVVLGLIFLKYISDAFEEHQAKLREGTADPDGEWYVKDAKQRYVVLEDRDEEHHRRKTFQDEVREFFRKHEVQFDERYVWD
jgi:type I restriction enzyme M protein